MKLVNEFTEKELEVVKVIINNWTDMCGGKTLEDMIDDNYSSFTPSDIYKKTVYSKNQIAGILGSLVKKEIIYSDTDDNKLLSILESYFVDLEIPEDQVLINLF